MTEKNDAEEYTMIRITKEQREMLKEAKYDFRVETYEDVVTALLKEHRNKNTAQ